jgi:hypothetical protein
VALCVRQLKFPTARTDPDFTQDEEALLQSVGRLDSFIAFRITPFNRLLTGVLWRNSSVAQSPSGPRPAEAFHSRSGTAFPVDQGASLAHHLVMRLGWPWIGQSFQYPGAEPNVMRVRVCGQTGW